MPRIYDEIILDTDIVHLLVCRYLRYMDYVMVWMDIPLIDRPRFNVVIENGEWVAKEV